MFPMFPEPRHGAPEHKTHQARRPTRDMHTIRAKIHKFLDGEIALSDLVLDIVSECRQQLLRQDYRHPIHVDIQRGMANPLQFFAGSSLSWILAHVTSEILYELLMPVPNKILLRISLAALVWEPQLIVCPNVRGVQHRPIPREIRHTPNAHIRSACIRLKILVHAATTLHFNHFLFPFLFYPFLHLLDFRRLREFLPFLLRCNLLSHDTYVKHMTKIFNDIFVRAFMLHYVIMCFLCL